MGKWDRFCQSCGMPMDADPGLGGTERDGDKSKAYCSYCYKDGDFVDNFTSAKQMIAFVKKQLKRQGLPWWKRWFYTSHIPRLGRWSS